MNLRTALYCASLAAMFSGAVGARAAATFTKLQLLMPGETASPGSPSGKTGTPTDQTAGATFTVTVNAVDTNWSVVSSTHTIGITSSDANAVLPANALMVAGTKTFNVTLKTAGSRTVTATDITDGTKTNNTSPATTVSAATFTKLQLLMPGETAAPGGATGKTGTPTTQTAGAAFNVTVNSVDTNWNVVSATDIMGITSSDTNAVLPATAALVAGTQTFSVVLKTSGSRTVTATNITDATKTSNVSPATTVNAATFIKLQLLMPGETAAPGTASGKIGSPTAASAGAAFNVTVNSVDTNWNVVSSTHTIGITTSDANATPPTSAALVAGTKTFSVTLKTVGSRTVTATDITDGTKTANTSPATTVSAGVFTKLQLLMPGESASPGSATGKTGTPTLRLTGVSFTVTVNAVDANWNVATSTDTIRITSSDTNAVLPANAALVAGTQTFAVALITGGSRTVTATNFTDGTKTANTSPATTVNLLWKGQSFTVVGTGAGALTNADGTMDMLRGPTGTPGDVVLNLTAIAPTNSGGSLVNIVGTPWIQWSYIDPGETNGKNVDIFIQDAVHTSSPRIQAGSLFFYEGLGYVRFGATNEEIPFVVGSNTRSVGKVHTLYVGKRLDGTVDYKFDGVCYTSFLLTTNVGAWDFDLITLRLRGGLTGQKAVFTDFQYGDNHTNRAPTLAALGNPAAILEDAGEQTVPLSGISDGEGGSQILSVTATGNHPGLFSSLAVNYTSPGTSGTITYQPAPDASGTNVITVRVEYNDAANGGVSAIERTFTVVVLSVNDAPTLAAITDPSPIFSGAVQQTMSLSGISAGGGETQTLAVTALSDTPALIANPTVTYSSPGSTGTLSYQPVANASGSAVITVRVDDDGGSANGGVNWVERSFTVVVARADSSIALSSSANPSPTGSNLTFTVTVTAVSPATGTPTGTVQFIAGGAPLGSPVAMTNGIATLITSSLSHGTHTIAAEFAGDGGFFGSTNGLSPNQLINTSPVANLAIYTRAASMMFKISIADILTNFTSDADGDVRTLLSIGSGTNGATITNNSTYIFYSPSGSNAASNTTDHFDYRISDGFAASTATNTVRINLDDSTIGNQSANMTGIAVVGAMIQVTFDGIPGHTYHVQRTTTPNGTNTVWEILGTATPDSLGIGVFVDAEPPPEQAFYRTVSP